MTYGGTFSGIGGLDRGLDLAGMECRWQVEKDKQATKVLAARWPDIPHHYDIQEVNGADLERVDLLAGGFPCQDVSKGGKRAGLAGARSGLFFEYVRIAEELGLPPWLVIENVPGLLSSAGGRDMGTVLGALGDLGYGWAYRVLDARFFGSPQRRLRLFIVGRLGSQPAAEEVLLGPGSGAGDPEPDDGTGAPAAARAGVGPVGRRLIFRKSRRAQNTPESAAARGESLSWETWIPDDFCNTLNRFDTGLVRSTTLVIEGAQGVRIMTPEEWEAAQGLDPGWTAPGSDAGRCKRVGNAVNVQVAEWIGRRIIEVHQPDKETV
jgi:DNA (cytosine-5)-methyltransferase 1